LNLYAAVVIERARELMQAPAAEPVPSPCNSVCRIDPRTQWCEGCFRTLDEIAAWGRLDDAQRRIVWRDIAERAGGPQSGRADEHRHDGAGADGKELP
jgi:uncharacterized protein